jgi:hypothetical protein
MLGTAVHANSSVITTAAGIENREWLEFSYTKGMSRNSVEQGLLKTSGFEGYRYATKAEAKALLSSYFNDFVSELNSSWKKNAAEAAVQFLFDFGVTKEITAYDHNQSLDLDNGEMLPYEKLDQSYFYYGDYGTDLPSSLEGVVTVGGAVCSALYESSHVAGQFIADELWGAGNQLEPYFSSLLLREKNDDPAPIPEPKTPFLVFAGLAGLLIFRGGSKFFRGKYTSTL